ncbi:MAG: hypothetical protein E7172_00365 [Firmicutes bacterium]|nr:hypothetical protein [Bacillota bacterium]
MKRKIGILLGSFLLVAGCGVPKLENGQEAVVSFKNGEKISVDDLYKKIKDDYALNTLITMVDLHLFETEFKDYIETAESYAENMIKATQENYGGETEFLQALQQSGFSTIKAYQEYIYLSYLQNHAIEEYAKLQVKDKEIETYYNDKAQGDVEISHILITADITNEMTEDEKTEAKDKAKSQAKDIIKQLEEAENLEEKFNELVKEHSKDQSTIDKKGSLGKVTYGDLSKNYDELLDEAYKIKDGEISKNVITTELGYHVILKTKTHEKESLEDLKDEIKQILADDLLLNDKDISIKALEYYREENDVKIEDSELNKQYEQYLQNVKAQVNQQQ